MSLPLRLGALLLVLFTSAGAAFTQTVLSQQDKQLIADFEKRAKEFVGLRNEEKKKLPAISKDSTPEQIEAYKNSLQAAIRTRRANAKEGDIFTPSTAVLLRRLIKNEFTDFEKSELRKTVLEADTKGVPLKVNWPYPETKELVHMPPPLLLTLPQLPQELRYRFVGRALVLLDRDGSLIIDFMRDALP